MKPLFDVVSLCVVELTAQLVTEEGSQIATSINKKFSILNVMFLGETVEKCCRGIGPVTAVDVDFEE